MRYHRQQATNAQGGKYYEVVITAGNKHANRIIAKKSQEMKGVKNMPESLP
jgi:hypothetical protein